MSDVSDESRERRWPKVQPNAVRSAIVGLLALAVCVCSYWYLVLGGRISIPLSVTFILCTVLFTGLFMLLGESVFEDDPEYDSMAPGLSIIGGWFPGMIYSSFCVLAVVLLSHVTLAIKRRVQ